MFYPNSPHFPGNQLPLWVMIDPKSVNLYIPENLVTSPVCDSILGFDAKDDEWVVQDVLLTQHKTADEFHWYQLCHNVAAE